MDEIRRLEKLIDEYPFQLPLMRQQRQYAIWNLLCVHEGYLYFVGEEAYESGAHPGVIVDGAKYALKFSLDWVFQKTRPLGKFRPPRTIKHNAFREAEEVFRLGLEYNGIEAAYTVFSRGDAQAKIIDENTVKFERNPEECRYDVLDRLVLGSTTHEQRTSARRDIATVGETLRSIRETVKIVEGPSVSFELAPDDITILIPKIENMIESSFLFPSVWNFRGISIESFRRVWIVLNAMAFLHVYCHLSVLRKHHVVRSGYTSFLWTQRRGELVDAIHRFTPGIASEEIMIILDLLTYDPVLPKPDPALQPFIPLQDDYLGVAPQLISSSRHERNLMALLSRAYKDEYDKTTQVLEDSLLSRIQSDVKALGYEVNSKVKIPDKHDLPDIDLAIYDCRDQILVLVEVKWVIAPSETYEIYARAETEKKGISQIQTLIEFFGVNIDNGWSACFPALQMPSNLRTHGIVCMRGFVGTARNFSKGTPVVEYSLFMSQLSKQKRLSEICEWAQNRHFLPVEGRDFHRQDVEIGFGPYTVIWEETIQANRRRNLC